MIAIVTVLLAFPLGYLVRSRLTANVTYAIAYLWAYTFQAVYLLIGWLGEDPGAFREEEFPLDYGLVTLGIFVVGFGLVALGRWVADRRRARRTAGRGVVSSVAGPQPSN